MMAAPPLMRSLSTRAVKKLEKPRPLKISSSQNKIGLSLTTEPSPGRVVNFSLNDLMLLIENISKCLAEKFFNDSLFTNISIMLSQLTEHGHQLETIYKDQLDRAFVVFRNGCQDDALPYTTKLHLLNIVELRANQWAVADNTQFYYSAKMAATDVESTVSPPDLGVLSTSPVPTTPVTPTPPSLSPGEVLKPSGKYKNGPARVPNKNYCKDEVVIRNADSGKVEFTRPPIIKSPMFSSARYLYPPTFLRSSYPTLWPSRPLYIVNPGAKERLVQITGPTEDHVLHATSLIKDTIIRNASPVREGGDRERMGGSSSSLNSSASDESGGRGRRPLSGSRRPGLLHSYSTNDASLGEYKYTITLGNDTIKISGTNHETVKNARLLLEENYSSWVQRNTIGDGFLLEDSVFLDSGTQEFSMPRLNSVDSGFDTGLSYPALYVPVPIPQPERRAVLGRSDSIPELSPPLKLPPEEMVTRRYTREFLMECKQSHLSRMSPPNWDQITAECPAIVRKVHSLPLLQSPHYYSYDNYIPPPLSPYTYSQAWTYVHPYSFPN